MSAEHIPAPRALDGACTPEIRLGLSAPGTRWERPLALPADQLDHHLLIAGAPGDGRGRLLASVAMQAAGLADGDGRRCPMLVLDTARQTVERVAGLIWHRCPERREDLVLADLVTPYQLAQFNPLDIGSSEDIPAAICAASEILAAAADSDPPADCLDTISLALRAICEANLSLEGTDRRGNVLHLVAFLSRPEFRTGVVARCADPEAAAFFAPEHGTFDQMSSRDRFRVLSFALSATATLEPLPFTLCHALPSRFDLDAMLAGRRIVLVRLTRAYAGTPCQLGPIGAMLAERAARARCRIVIDDAPALFSDPERAEKFLGTAEDRGAGVIAALNPRAVPDQPEHAERVAAWIRRCRSRVAMSQAAPVAPGPKPFPRARARAIRTPPSTRSSPRPTASPRRSWAEPMICRCRPGWSARPPPGTCADPDIRSGLRTVTRRCSRPS